MNDIETFKSLLVAKGLIIEEKTYNRNDFLIKRGDPVTFLYWIETGTLRAYLVDDRGEEQNIRFGYAEDLLTSISSAFQNKPSDLYLQALKKTKVNLISIEQLKKTIQKDSEFSIIWIKILEKLVCDQVEREVDLLTNDPKTRYQRVFQRSSKLFQEISSRHIANYLRMTPETLSRIRKS